MILYCQIRQGTLQNNPNGECSMKTTILAYRNNATWQALQDNVLALAKASAGENESELVVKIFEPADGSQEIDSWIESLTTTVMEVVGFILDDTVCSRLRALEALGFDDKKLDRLNGYLHMKDGYTLNHMPVEQLYKTCYARLAESVRPDMWVIITTNAGDYDPLGTSEGGEAYAKRLKSFIPEGQDVVIWHSWQCDQAVMSGKKVIMIYHHHAWYHIKDRLSGQLDGSLRLEPYFWGFLPQVNSLIRTDDLIGTDVLEVIRQQLSKRTDDCRSRNVK